MPPVSYRNPVYDGYFADPFVLAWEDRYVAYGTGAVIDGLVFETLVSDDLVSWQRHGGALQPVPPELGRTYWAPEVVSADGAYWMYYSVGAEEGPHHLRVAHAASPLGPFVDSGVNLTRDERFAIDAHPFQDVDGTWYLFYARDVLDGPRVGTQLAVDVLTSMTSRLGSSSAVLAPTADWQLFEANRQMYGGTYDWYTLEGPCVRRVNGVYYCLYSGGSWLGPGYGVAWARASHPLGPWEEPASSLRLLQSVPGQVRGPGHCSVVRTHGGVDLLAYHAWNESSSRRQMCLDRLDWDADGPRTLGPTWQDQLLPD